MSKGYALVAVAVATVLSSPLEVWAQPTTVSEATRCEIVKLKALVKELKDKSQCYERSLKANVPVSEACFDRAEHKRERLFERAEDRGACKTVKDGASFSTRVDAFLRDVTASLRGVEAEAKKEAASAEEEAKEKTAEATATKAKADGSGATDDAGAASGSSEKEG